MIRNNNNNNFLFSINFADNEKEMVMKLIKNRNVSFDSKLIRIEGEPPFKPKKVVVFISPKQFTIKEHMLKFIPRHVAAFRLCPCTKVRIHTHTQCLLAYAVFVLLFFFFGFLNRVRVI